MAIKDQVSKLFKGKVKNQSNSTPEISEEERVVHALNLVYGDLVNDPNKEKTMTNPEELAAYRKACGKARAYLENIHPELNKNIFGYLGYYLSIRPNERKCVQFVNVQDEKNGNVITNDANVKVVMLYLEEGDLKKKGYDQNGREILLEVPGKVAEKGE